MSGSAYVSTEHSHQHMEPVFQESFSTSRGAMLTTVGMAAVLHSSQAGAEPCVFTQNDLADRSVPGVGVDRILI